MIRNPYCGRLGISPPAVEHFVDHPRASLLKLMTLALLEHGEPLALEEIATRLLDAGVRAPSGDMVYSLRKAWHGLPPVIKEPDGTMGLDLESWDLDHLVFELGLKSRDVAAEVPAQPPVPELPAHDVPLREEEIREALRKPGLSNVRTVAALLDLRGEALDFEQVREMVERLAGQQWRPPRPFVRNRFFTESEEGLLIPSVDTTEFRTLRRAVRAIAREAWARKAQQEHQARQIAAYREAAQERQRREAAEAAGMRKALVWALPRERRPAVVSILDLRSRQILSYAGASVGAARDALKGFNVVYGLEVRATLAVLGLDVLDFRLFELRPPRKSIQLNRAGKKLHVTPELVITSTTGIGHPLADPVKVAQYAAEGDSAKLVRRIESDVKSLYAYYRYGVLHGHVRLRWGFVDEVFGVDWALPDDHRLHEVLRRAMEEEVAIDLVTGSSPGWNDPWSRATRWRLVEMDFRDAIAEQEGVRQRLLLDEIQAVRLAGSP
jgi:hypothetical protein